MSHRPLAIVTGLTIGDYLLWNWSLNANHDVLALVSGLTLPPLTIAWVWLMALTAARLIAQRSRRRAQHTRPQRTRSGVRAEQPQPQPGASASAAPARRSRKIAA